MHLILKIMTVMLPFYEVVMNEDNFAPPNAILTESNLAIEDESGNPLLTE